MIAEDEAGLGCATPGHGNLPLLPGGLLERPALVDRVLSTPAGGLCLVDAPAGCGATTLLLAAASQSPSAVAWISLDARGLDPTSFWHRVLAGLTRAGVEVETRATDVSPADPATEGEVALAELAEALGRHEPGVLVVVDDLDAEAHQAVLPSFQGLVEALPLTARVAVRVRGGQPFDVSRLLPRGRLVLISEDDLALSPAEVEAFLAAAVPHVAAERRRLLASLSEGRWGPLAATAAGAGDDPLDDPVAWLLGPGVELLFRADVDRLRPGDRSLLVGTSVMEVLSADACDAILGRSDSGTRLARLEGKRLIRRVPSDRGLAYRTHGLLSEYLRRRLAEGGRGSEARAHRAAATWLIDQGGVEDAITHLLEAGDTGEAMSLLESHLSTLLDTGRVAAVRRWYHAAPGHLVTEDHLHLLGSAWAEVMGGNVAGAREQVLLLRDAVDRLATDGAGGGGAGDDGRLGSGPAWLRAETELLSAYLAGWHGYPGRLLNHVRHARAFYGDSWTRTAHQVAAFLQVRGHLWAGDPVGARPLLLDAVARARTREHFRLVTIPSLRALLAVEEGRAHRAAHLAGDALAWLNLHGAIGAVDHCDARLALARALVDLDDLAAAEGEAILLLNQVEPVRHATYEMLGHLVLAAVRAARGDVPGTAAQVDIARQVARDRAPGSDVVASIDGTDARLRLDLGDAQGSRRLVRRMPPSVERDLLQARLLGADTHGAAERRFREIRPTTPRQAVELRLLLAGSVVRLHPLEAESHLVAAAEAAFEYGMHRLLVGRPAEVMALADRACRRSASPAVSRLLEVARGPQVQPEDRVEVRLSPGELELLRLLPTRRGNAELAAELGVSINTVKTRLRRLFAKLEVHDRDAAVRRAVSLGLVP